uniref:Uncharacterized protein n=1 Tax=Klebsiella pneumoniae TaxID=573 RepID=A0A3G1IE77_KLEPN|nr:hypothetical protein pPUTH1_0202 [Klebsiella pneumoniae]
MLLIISLKIMTAGEIHSGDRHRVVRRQICHPS